MKTRTFLVIALLFLAVLSPAMAELTGFITMTNGYFYDSGTGRPWVPHGIAYQTWNRPLGIWQTFDQIDYDLDEMVKMGANSIRVDFVWQHIEEDGDNQWKWENYDYLVQAAEQRGLRIFALIGYQWPPNWFPDEWYTQHPPEIDSEGIAHTNRWQSDIINYEHPEARAQYTEWFQNVCSRYKDSKAIVGWIIGNESGYLGLWSGLLDGYDPESEAAFRQWCQTKYGAIANANSAWGTSFTSFSNVVFVDQYRAYGVEGAIWADMVQWREDSIGSFTALGAVAAKSADTNHLISYSTVGMQWGEEDWRYHAEDREKITVACLAANAPIDFFSVNNYPWSVLGHESQNGHWGISYTKKTAGVPVLYSETGFTSSETMWPGMNEQRQGPLIRNALWESLTAGAIGTHIFAWHDRPFITDREKGFGILYANRGIKPAFWVSRNAYMLMEQMDIHSLLMNSQDPEPDIAFLWTDANDSQYNRYECEMQQIAGALERLGYAPYFMNLNDLSSGAYTNYKLIILPRNMRMEAVVPNSGGKGVLEFLRTVVIPAGVHVMATADLPGMQNELGRPLASFEAENNALFGIDVSDAGGFESPQRRRHYVSWYFDLIEVDFTTNAIGSVAGGYHYWPFVWKFSDEVRVTDGQLWATMNTLKNRGFEDSTNEVARWKGSWGNTPIVSTEPWTLAGTNMVQLWGDAGFYMELPVVPFGRYTHNMYLRSNAGDALRDGSSAHLALEWYDEYGYYLGADESPRLAGATPSDSWVRYRVDAVAPSNAWTARRVVRVGPANLLSNGTLTGSGDAPAGWSSSNNDSHDADTGIKLTSSGNAWAFWWEGGLYQDVTSGFSAGDTVRFGGFLQTPGSDRLRNGDKQGTIALEFYQDSTLLQTQLASPALTATSRPNTWILGEASATVPAQANKIRVLVRCDNAASGDGRFLADGFFLRNESRGAGSVFADNHHEVPAVVTKNHGAAKSAIFLYSAGDMKPDGDLDKMPDTYNWLWRYDVFGAVIRDYFGVQPRIRVSGPNAYLCLADYRTCADGSTLWQIKNYQYDTNYPNGGPALSFTLTSDLFVGKTIRAYEQARIVEQNSDGTITLTLEPDGMELLHAYTSASNAPIVQLADAPSLIKPFGDKGFVLTMKYDTLGMSGLILKVVLKEKGDNGDGVTNEIIQMVSATVSGIGSTNLYVWVPDPDLTDPDYISSTAGGQYEFMVWLEDAEGHPVGLPATQDTALNWSVYPESPTPTNLVKGQAIDLPVTWENLYETLPWQNTPMMRNEVFPARVGLFRSTKTQALYPSHFERINQVCDWLESMGYSSGNPLDIAYDNVSVFVASGTNSGGAGPQLLFSDDVESGTNGWTASGLWHVASDQSDSPSHSWAYNNGFHYNTGARNSGSLTSPALEVPAGTSGAILTFKSWYETEDTAAFWDRKTVHISAGGGAWQQVAQVTGPNRQWTPVSCDLAAYAGQSVRVRFTFDTVDGVLNQFKGWYVDDVRVTIIPGEVETLFSDNMTATTNWTASGLWRLATNRFASPSTSWAYNNGSNYNTGVRNSGAIVSRRIDLSGCSSAILTFKSWYRTEDIANAWDRKLVEISLDGATWTRLLQVTGPNQAWTTQTCDLQAYAGRTNLYLRFFFDTMDAINNQYEGWYVDDVAITTVKGPGGGFNENAESGTNGWAATGLWHVAGDLSASPSHSWAYNNGVNYNTGARNSGSLTSPWIDLSAASSAMLSFKSWHQTEDMGVLWDKKTVLVSTDGAQWSQIMQISGLPNQWKPCNFDLSAYAGQQIKLRFFFDTMDGVLNAFRGWYVDDISVSMIGSQVFFKDEFSGTAASWTRAAGAANWAVTGGVLRAWRIGNDDNILFAGSSAWSNYTASVDIRYNQQDEYFNDAELYLRYQDRDNFVKVGIRNSYSFWRLKYTVRTQGSNVDQGWICEFAKTNRPVEGVWNTLAVNAEGPLYTVFFNEEEVGSFTVTNFSTGRIGVGCRAVQLGIWEPQKGYFFIDDDEYSYYSPNEGEIVQASKPLNLDWGYLNTFYPTLILPGTFVMSDIEASNVVTWLNLGYYNLIATEGGIAMRNETGAFDLGRIEPLFGVESAVVTNFQPSSLVVGGLDHYVTLDYAEGDSIAASGASVAWTETTEGRALAQLSAGQASVPALIVNTLTNDPLSPRNVFCFNFAVPAQGQLTNQFSQIATRAFEWSRGQAHKVRVLLKYMIDPALPDADLTLKQWDFWMLGGSGSNTLSFTIPQSNIMTGTNLYWVMYAYPWEALDPWIAHDGFYTSGNDGSIGPKASLAGIGLQILGEDKPRGQVFGGRAWDIWCAYNTQGQPLEITYGIKDKGALLSEDAFAGASLTGWTVNPSPNNQWSLSNGHLRATSRPQGGYSVLSKDGLNVADKNVTVEYEVRYMNGATKGGLVYRGHVLEISPRGIAWTGVNPLNLGGNSSSNFSGLVTNADGSVSYVVTGGIEVFVGWPGVATSVWNRVLLSVREGESNLVSDLFVNGAAVFMNQPLPSTNWTSTGAGLLSAYTNGYCEWDNFRVCDEIYSFATQTINGVFVPTNDAQPTFLPFVPDINPNWWEYEGATLGGPNEWFAYFKGEGVQGHLDVDVLFTPRLMIELTNFPVRMNMGTVVQVPVEWENFTNLPAVLRVELNEAFNGLNRGHGTGMISTVNGSAWIPVTISSNIPAHNDYVWLAYVYPTNSPEPYNARSGADDTFNYDPSTTYAFYRETVIGINTPPPTTNTFDIYSDAGLFAGSDVYPWGGGSPLLDGSYAGDNPPEGSYSFRTMNSQWVGWGIFATGGNLNLSAYTNGYLKFWYKNNQSQTMTLAMQGPQGTERTLNVTAGNGAWQEISIALTNFNGINFGQVYCPFAVTWGASTSNLFDHIHWSSSP